MTSAGTWNPFEFDAIANWLAVSKVRQGNCIRRCPDDDLGEGAIAYWIKPLAPSFGAQEHALAFEDTNVQAQKVVDLYLPARSACPITSSASGQLKNPFRIQSESRAASPIRKPPG